MTRACWATLSVSCCLAVQLTLSLGGCAGRAPAALPDGPLVSGEGAGIDPWARLAPGEDQGPLQRAAVDEVLLQGPQRFIRRIRLSPATVAGKFVGHRVDDIARDDPILGTVDIHPGDVIVGVNGMPLERPDQFMAAWEGLKEADELRLEFLRGGRALVLRWEIVDPRTTPAPPPAQP